MFGSRHSGVTLRLLHSAVCCEDFSLSAFSLGIGQVGHRELNCTGIKVVMLNIQGDSNMTGSDYIHNYTQSVPVIFEPACNYIIHNQKALSQLHDTFS
jgi:hypothetical protein